MWVWMVICFCVLALWQTGDLFSVYPASRPVTAGMDSSPRATLSWISRNKWMDGVKTQWSVMAAVLSLDWLYIVRTLRSVQPRLKYTQNLCIKCQSWKSAYVCVLRSHRGWHCCNTSYKSLKSLLDLSVSWDVICHLCLPPSVHASVMIGWTDYLAIVSVFQAKQGSLQSACWGYDTWKQLLFSHTLWVSFCW